MRAIVKIGHLTLLVKNEASAMAVIKALSGAIEIKWDYDRNSAAGKEFYTPDDIRHPLTLSLEIVQDSQIRNVVPKAEKAAPTPPVKQIGNGPKLLNFTQ